MEPTNHPFKKKNDLPNFHEDMFQPFIFRGVTSPIQLGAVGKISFWRSVGGSHVIRSLGGYLEVQDT